MSGKVIPVEVKPNHLKMIVGLGARRLKVDDETKYGTTAEDLAEILDLEEGTVLEALDELIKCAVVADIDAEYFYLTEEKGALLFDAIMESVKEITK